MIATSTKSARPTQNNKNVLFSQSDDSPKKTADDLLAQADQFHRQVIKSLRNAIYFAKEAGDALRKAKSLMPYGEWDDWLCERTESPQTYRHYMRIAKHWRRLRPIVASNSRLTIDRALKILRHHHEPKEPTPDQLEDRRERKSIERDIVRAFRKSLHHYSIEYLRTANCYAVGLCIEFRRGVERRLEEAADSRELQKRDAESLFPR